MSGKRRLTITRANGWITLVLIPFRGKFGIRVAERFGASPNSSIAAKATIALDADYHTGQVVAMIASFSPAFSEPLGSIKHTIL